MKFLNFVRALICTLPLFGVIQAAAALDSEAENLRLLGRVEGAITYSPYLRGSKIKVILEKDQLTLRGYADSELSKALAEQLALSVKGIKGVFNELKVIESVAIPSFSADLKEREGQDRLSNVTISNKVRSQLLANRSTSGMNIEIETRRRVVTLSGQVSSEQERELAYWIVSNTQGVTAVVDHLDIESSGQRQAAIDLEEVLGTPQESRQ